MAFNQRQETVSRGLDWTTVALYGFLVLFGWMNIFAAVYQPEQSAIFTMSTNSGRQLIWIGTALVLITAVMTTDTKFYENFAYVIYGVVLLMLVAVLFVGKVKGGSRSWFGVGDFGIQPAEFAKLATALALAKYLELPTMKLEKIREQLGAALILLIPAALILLQNDTGSTLVFSIFIVVLFREGLSPIYPAIGLAMVTLLILTLGIPEKLYLDIALVIVAGAITFLTNRRRRNYLVIGAGLLFVLGVVHGVDYFVNNILQPHQRSRINVLFDPNSDPLGAGWNVTQSKIAIGSGGIWGKGFLDGTQTKFDFVPEQSTDFIFCTIGEEHGWMGSLLVISLFVFFLIRLTMIAERQKTKFARVYGYGVASIFFFHFTINIGMTIGLFPVIGIPLPFFSYGGSSLWSFTVLLFILLKLDAHRGEMLQRQI